MTRKRLTRRKWLLNSGLGFGSLALTSMLHRDQLVASERSPQDIGSESATWRPTPPKAKRVIWLFMIGGTSHMESFDPKPALNEYAGKTIDETPHKNVLDSSFLENQRDVFEGFPRPRRTKIFPMQIGFRQAGESGLSISDWWPNLSECVDQMAVVRSMWTEDIDHGAQLQFHTGRHRNDGFFPTLGSWVSYGLGHLNENLPEFVVLGSPPADCCGGKEAHRASYLGPQYDGIPLAVGANTSMPYLAPDQQVYKEEQLAQFELLANLNRLSSDTHQNDQELQARMRAYELAFRMQSAVPEVVQLSDETDETRELYGLNDKVTEPFARQLITARRLAERDVRFIQVYHGSNGSAGTWDSHGNLKANHERVCRQVDRPIAGLLKDLARRGMLDDTLVVWATEFGRTPGSEGENGRDHHPFGFSVWLAGGGIKGGIAHGATDELGFHAVENRHYVTDIHATVLHQLGLDPRLLAIEGRKRLERDYGNPIREIIA